MATRKVKIGNVNPDRLLAAGQRARQRAKKQRKDATWWYNTSEAYRSSGDNRMAEYTADRGGERDGSAATNDRMAVRMQNAAYRLRQNASQRATQASKASGGKG